MQLERSKSARDLISLSRSISEMGFFSVAVLLLFPISSNAVSFSDGFTSENARGE